MTGGLRRTPLHDTHRSAGARLVPFAGWEMPVQYDGVLAEHRAVRERVGVFDVSHMGQLHVEGPNAAALLQATLSNDLGRIADGEAQYTLLTDLSGGIIDDLIVYRLTPHHFLLVVNAGNRDEAYAWLKEREVRGSEVRDASDEYAMLAVQGPAALAALGLADGHTFTHAIGAIDGIEAMVCRTGYTGERGVELLCPAENAVELWEAVVARDATPCGLAARDTLRLEMCYPLHGSDITRETDPISAGLGWACVLEKEFTGVGALRRVREEGQERKLVAFVMEDKAVPRQGMAILEGGVVSSGTHSPSLDFGIGMAWVPAALAAIGTELTVDVRGRERRARVVRKPIYSREDR